MLEVSRQSVDLEYTRRVEGAELNCHPVWVISTVCILGRRRTTLKHTSIVPNCGLAPWQSLIETARASMPATAKTWLTLHSGRRSAAASTRATLRHAREQTSKKPATKTTTSSCRLAQEHQIRQAVQEPRGRNLKCPNRYWPSLATSRTAPCLPKQVLSPSDFFSPI